MKKFYSIEVLRLLTSISVLLYHYRLFFAPYNSFSFYNFDEKKVELPFYSFLNIFYNDGIYGVHVFYAISGFVFALVYLSSEQAVSGKKFFINRFGRLYPLHFATLILVTFLLLLNLLLNETYNINPFTHNDPYHFFLHLLFISSWGFENGHSFNTPIWSVSVEIAIYILFFFLLNFLKNYKIWLTIFLCVFLLVINKTNINDSLFLECARLFFSGVLVFQLISLFKNHYILMITSIILIVISIIGNFKTYLFCPSILLFVTSFEAYISNTKIKNLFTFCGNLTYALYLLHYPIILSFVILQKKIDFPQIIFEKTYFFFIFIILLIYLAHFCFKFYENPLNKKIRNYLEKKLKFKQDLK